MRILGRLAVACSIFASFAFATNIVDSRDNHNYKTIPSGKLNWSTNDLSFKDASAHMNKGTGYYPYDSWQKVCPEGSHVPTIAEWDEFKKDRFMGPRKVPNVKSFAGKTRGYFDQNDSKKKIKNKDVAYFAIAGAMPQAMMLDIKRGNAKQVSLAPTALIAVRCVSERDLFAEKNVSEKDMVLTDQRDGKTYKVEKRGNRLWMTQNLRFSLQSAKQCFLEDTLFCKKHGRFYTYYEAKKACPQGWHLPDDGEWRDYQRESVNWDNMGVGGCKDWDEYCDATNTGHYWSSTSIKKNTGRSWEFRRLGKNINRTDESTQKGLYVRCVAELE